jgi:integrase/recombinase XerD
VGGDLVVPDVPALEADRRPSRFLGLRIIAMLLLLDRSGSEERLMTMCDQWAAESLLAAFDEHLRRRRGLCAGARRNYVRHVRGFLAVVSVGERVDLSGFAVADVVGHVSELTRRYRPGTVELAASSLRSFFRFLRVEGLRADRLEDAVPMVPHRRGTGLPRHLDSDQFARLLASLDSSTPRGLRDRAIMLCMARLGMRAGEVTQLRLEDIDWRNATIRVRARKTGHGALLPLPHQVGEAVADYLRRGRPATTVRQVFVLHRQRVGAPISSSIVERAVGHALRTANIDAPIRGANLLRHSLATDLLAHGASLTQIGDLFGHRALTSTAVYASVDVAALREVALPWPRVTR